jgi:hypothetical protein
MAYIFPSQVGVPAVVQDPNATPATFNADLDNWNGAQSTSCIITGMSFNVQGNYQFLLTLRNYTYVYVFGERMGDFTISGISLAGICDGGADGMSSAIDYYSDNCISATGQPIMVTIAGYAIYAFLCGGSFQYQNPESRLGQFAYVFKAIADPS